ncbi:MAG: nucleotidyltransferase domain-containing protein [Bauldia sp.]|nr:nucleotidyltransferase domain-containing protein [Bauldia sp.]
MSVETQSRTEAMSRDEIVAGLKALRPDFEREGVTSVVLFGSRARGDNRPDSDIDLMIEVDEARKFSLVELARIVNTIEDRFFLPANLFMRRSSKPSLLAAAIRDGRTVF